MADPVATAAVAFGAKEIILGLGTAVISLLQWINRSQINGLKLENARLEKKFDDEIKEMKADFEKKNDQHREHIIKIFQSLEEIKVSIAGLVARQN